MLCEQDEVDTLWKQIERAPRKKRARSAETPEEAIATLERAAIEGDVQQMRSMLSKKLYEQAWSAGVRRRMAEMIEAAGFQSPWAPPKAAVSPTMTTFAGSTACSAPAAAFTRRR